MFASPPKKSSSCTVKMTVPRIFSPAQRSEKDAGEKFYRYGSRIKIIVVGKETSAHIASAAGASVGLEEKSLRRK